MDSREIYGTWHGGQGVLMVVDKADVPEIVRRGHVHSILALPVGFITEEAAPRLTLQSRFDGSVVEYS